LVAFVAFVAFVALSAVVALGTLPSEDSSISEPVRVSALTSRPRSVLFRTSCVFTWLFTMSPEVTVFDPGRATAVPPSAASSAMNATPMDGDGSRLNLSPIRATS
jgi:hypothetical protein